MEAIYEAPAAVATKRVLIVEDDQILARIYWKKLITVGYSVEVASDGLKAVEMAQTFQPDLIVLDLMLPGLNGVQVLERLRAMPATRGLPVLFFTNQFMGELLRAARGAGATKVLNKTESTPASLAAEIEAIIGDSTHPSTIPGTMPVEVTEPPADKFTREATGCVTELTRLLEAFLARGNGDLSRLMALMQHVRAVTKLATAAEFVLTAHLAGALTNLLQALIDDPNTITPSARTTVTKGVHCLAALITFPEQPTSCDFSGLSVLAVDDDWVSLRLMSNAMTLVKLRTESISNPLQARQRLTEKSFNLILLDIEMPDLNGMQLCQQLREFPANANTPVVYVTAVDDFDRRETALAHGADDLISKPYMSIELAVKALTHILTARG